MPEIDDATPSLLMAHTLAESLCQDKLKTGKLAEALSFASTAKKEESLATAHP